MQRMRAWRRIGGGLLSAAAVLALAGCANAEPSVVAYVGDDRITQGQFDRAVAGVDLDPAGGSAGLPGRGGQRDDPRRCWPSRSRPTRNVTVTDAQRDEFLQTTDLAVLLNDPDARALAYDVADQQLVSQKVGAEAYVAAVREQPVTLNPRFGVLDPAQKLITSVEQTGSLSRPAPLATPNP